MIQPPPIPLVYQSPASFPPRRIFAWLPAVCVLIVAASPVAFQVMFASQNNVADTYRDFGLVMPQATQAAIDAMYLYFAGGWLVAVAIAIGVGFITPLNIPRPQAAGRAILTWGSLILALGLSTIVIGLLQELIVVMPMYSLIQGISGGAKK